MEEIINKLYEAYRTEEEKFIKYSELYGMQHQYTDEVFHEMKGFEKAFLIVAGMSPAEYLLKKYGFNSHD